jgi:hypothetical protein
MAIIPGSAKVLNQYENVNTTYGGSKAMKAQSKWYTMDDVIETIEAEGTGISGSGTVNYVPKFTGSEEVGDSQIFDDGTNVGIGTDTPVVNFQVEGTVFAGFYGGPGGYLEVGTTGASCQVQSSSQPTTGVSIEEGGAWLGTNIGGDFRGVRMLHADGVWFNNEANCKFGLDPIQNTLFAENDIIQNSDVPSNTLTPAKWIKIYDFDGGEMCYIPVYI